MCKFFWENYKNFFAIIIATIIIGGFIYFGLKNDSNVVAPTTMPPVLAPAQAYTKNLSQYIKISPAESKLSCGAEKNTIVTKVIDGDTVVVEGGYHVRLLGMDADEKGYPCYDSAKTRLEQLVLAKQIILEKDKTDVDQYGRCLRYIFLGNTNIDTQLVAEGLAVARFYAPDVKYRTEITAAEQQAQQNKIGCKWSSASQTAQ